MPADEEIHEIPDNELDDHDRDPECGCDPECSLIKNSDGSKTYVYTHIPYA